MAFSRPHIRLSHGDFLNTFAMKASAGPYVRIIIVLDLSILFQVWAIVCLGLIISIPPSVSSPFPTILSV